MADMAEQDFDEMRWHAELVMQRRRERAPQIVHNPVHQRCAVTFCEMRCRAQPWRRSTACTSVRTPDRGSIGLAASCAAINARTGADIGTRCGRPFFVALGDRVIRPASRSISLQRNSPISPRRRPVRISSFTIAPYRSSASPRQINVPARHPTAAGRVVRSRSPGWWRSPGCHRGSLPSPPR